MKTLLEQAKEFLQKEGWFKESTGMFDRNGLADILSSFAHQAVHKALEEAAEKTEEKMKPFDVKSVCKIITDSILSLKEKY